MRAQIIPKDSFKTVRAWIVLGLRKMMCEETCDRISNYLNVFDIFDHTRYDFGEGQLLTAIIAVDAGLSLTVARETEKGIWQILAMPLSQYTRKFWFESDRLMCIVCY